MRPDKSTLNQNYRKYRQELIKRFWDFQQVHFKIEEGLFEMAFDLKNPGRPPVFRQENGENNVLINQNWSDEIKKAARDTIPKEKWHRWFTSMTSSQALAQSIFGNLKVLNKLDCLADLRGDDGTALFVSDNVNLGKLRMEHQIKYLGETIRKTHVDVFFGGDFQVAVECKLLEREVGPCSRPRLREGNPSYSEQYCDGNYVRQWDRKERCVLTERKVKYWEYIPKFFSWAPNKDCYPCPLNPTYQLVRNVLAASLKAAADNEDGENARQADGHAVLVYDERNPEFLEGGKGFAAWKKTKEGLKIGREGLLQKCTWQQIISAMKREPELSWLVEMLHKKYGFCLEIQNI